MTTWNPTGIPLAQLAADAGHLDTPAFRARWGDSFFVLLGIWTGAPRQPRQTQRHIPVVDERVRADLATTSMLVYPVRGSPQSQLTFVCVGRLEGNDIALPDDTVSKFHAYIKADEDGSLTSLQDGRSRNGTFVDGQPVAARGSGPPTKLRSGQTVRFGSVSMAFLDAAGIMLLIRSAAFLEPAARTA